VQKKKTGGCAILFTLPLFRTELRKKKRGGKEKDQKKQRNNRRRLLLLHSLRLASPRRGRRGGEERGKGRGEGGDFDDIAYFFKGGGSGGAHGEVSGRFPPLWRQGEGGEEGKREKRGRGKPLFIFSSIVRERGEGT